MDADMDHSELKRTASEAEMPVSASKRASLDGIASPVQTPDWVKDSVFLQIFPDRFAKSDKVAKASNLEPWDSPPTPLGYKGGDLLGVVEHLDHLSDLGVNAIYMCPIFQSASNHRYHTHDYYRVDPMLGGDEALKALLEAAHRRDIKVVIDGVFNHSSRGFFQFNDILENGAASAYVDWFHVQKYPLVPYACSSELHKGKEAIPCNYGCWWDLPALPKFNTDCQAVREYLWGVGEHWIKLGVDGWRLDVPSEIDDDDFWREFRRRVKAVNPEAYIVGEIWDDATRWLKGDQFDSVMNYPFTRFCLGFFGKSTLDPETFAGTGYGQIKLYKSGMQFLGDLDAELDKYDWNITQVQLSLLGSHDTPRFLTCASGDVSAYRLSVLFGITLPGAFCLYYGDEVGMSGGRDPDCRRGMIWDRAQWDADLLAFIKRMTALRHQNRVLRRGRFKALVGEGARMVIAFERRLHDSEAAVAIVVFNADKVDDEMHLHGIEAGTYTELVGGMGGKSTGSRELVVKADGKALIRVPRRSGMIFVKSLASGSHHL